MAKTPETSEHTSVRDRKLLTSMDGGYAVVMPGALPVLHFLHTSHPVNKRIRQHLGKSHQADNLLTMDGDNTNSQGIPFYLNDYLGLIDWTGFCVLQNQHTLHPCK